jgi:hypothetical protein
MPPQQSDRLLDGFDVGLRFRAHSQASLQRFPVKREPLRLEDAIERANSGA